MDRELPVRLEFSQEPRAALYDEQPTVCRPVDAERHRWSLEADDQLGLTVRGHGEHLARPPVAQPEPPVVPARRLGEAEALDQYVELAHSRLQPRAYAYRRCRLDDL